MATLTGRERSPQSRFDTMRALLARRRRNLLLPILMLVAVSLVAVAALLYWSANSLNQRDASAQTALVKSMVQIRQESLRQLVVDYAWWDEAIVSSGAILDERWAKEGLAGYLDSTFEVSTGWILSPAGEVRMAFDGGRSVEATEAPHLPPGAELLVAAARGAVSIEEVPPVGFVIYDQDLALLGASVVAPLTGANSALTSEKYDVMVFLQPLDLAFVTRAGIGNQIENLHFLRGKAPSHYLDFPVMGLEGLSIGSIVWYDQRPGDGLLWSVVPVMLVSLLAVGLLLVLAIKRVDTVVSREGRLSISLYQEQQRRSQKSDFVSMVSHELRTPLQAIGISADMLERFADQMSEAERCEETRTIRRAVSILARLVDDVLVMGRADATEHKGGSEPLDLVRFSRAMWREVSVALRSKQQMKLHDLLGEPVHGINATAMHTIFSNLMQNAIKYSRGEGSIEIELARDGEDYLVTVTDFGPGICEQQREAIFQPYWRAEEVDGIAGTGLGLSVARSAARSIGGDLILKSSGDGSGTRFVVRWPAPA